MHHTTLREIIRDTDIACAIRPTVRDRHMTHAETRDALVSLHIPRAAEIASLIIKPYPQHCPSFHV